MYKMVSVLLKEIILTHSIQELLPLGN